MTFPDQSHINRVRDALHQRSGNRASVMVGSGFSKSAERINLNAKEMPTWQDLVDNFHGALYPQDGTPHRVNNDRPAADNVRIAQEYEAAFGRRTLHDALRRLVPDAEYSPGIKHQRLLQLPWRDIYTTNWDTLLVLQRQFLNLVRHWPEIASRKAWPQSCQARGQVAMKKSSRSLSCEASL